MPGKRYPIWHSVHAGADYSSSKDFGSKCGSDQTIYVGRGASNSHELARVEVRECCSDKPGHTRFLLKVDGKVVKTLEVDVDKTGRVQVESFIDEQQVEETTNVKGEPLFPSSTMTVGRLLKRLSSLVLKGRGDEPILFDLPKRTYFDGDACTPRIVVKETNKDRLVLQIQRV